MPHLLVVDDDDDILDLLRGFFEKHDFGVTTAADGSAMFAALASEPIDLVILDVMLKGDDGFTLCRQLQADERRIPVIMLTAMADQVDRIVGLEIGADDYLTKPFDQRELLARVKAVLRRTKSASLFSPDEAGVRPTLHFAGWRLDVTRRELRSAAGALVLLTGGEFELLLVLAERPRRILSRDQLLDLTRGATHDAYDRSIDVHISRLRLKLEDDPKNPTVIRTVRNVGYIFQAQVTRA